MKNDLTMTFLNLALSGLVLLSVGFTLLVILREPKVPRYAAVAMQYNNNLSKVKQVLIDTAAYNATARDPDLERILQSAQQTSAPH
jgi:hypothetical protein